MSDGPGRSRQQVELEAWLRWLVDLRDTGSALLQLAAAELQLAASDLRRFILLSLLVLPVALLAWLGLAVFLSWVVYAASGSLGAAFAGFFLLHFGILLVIRHLLARYRKSMGLPVTRQHLGEIVKELRNAPQKPDTSDRGA